MKTTTAFLALALLLSVAPAGLAKSPAPDIDWDSYFAALPTMKELSQKSKQSIYDIHELVTGLEQTTDESKAIGLRRNLRKALENHRALKLEMIETVDKVLHRPEPARSDLETLRLFRYTTLNNVNWNNQFLKYVVRDLDQYTGIPMRLTAPVQELNQVDIRFPEVTAESALNLICQNFDLKWIIFEGEIIIYRQLNRNEERFLEYEKKHGKVDWIAEDKKSTYETLPPAEAKRELEKVENMDLPLLKGNLTKLYILEGESELHEVRLKELQLASKFAERLKNTMGQTEEEKEADEKRRKHIVHYLFMERDNATEVWHILNQVLGIRLQLEGDDSELRAILSKEVASIRWTNKDLEEALMEIGRLAGVPVEVNLPPNTEMTISLNVENVTIETVIGIVCDIQPMDYKYANGKLIFAALGED